MIREQKIEGRVKEIVMMGGGYLEGGKIKKQEELKIYVDKNEEQVVLR